MSKFETIAKVTPGFGYSVNCQAELFIGMTPDELGYFCEWTYNPENSPFRKAEYLLYPLTPVKKIYYLDRLLHKAISKLLGYEIKNIPFPYLSKFSKEGKDVFSPDFQIPSIIKEGKTIPCTNFINLSPTERDYQVYKRTINSIKENYNLVISFFGELDGIAHWSGVDSIEYRRKVEELDRWVWDLKSRFVSEYKNGVVIVVSDHGMVGVKEGKRIDLEIIFGTPNDKTYFYFLEGTILRLWTFNSNIKQQIEDYLFDLKYGSIIFPEERKKYGISSRKFGDIIFLADESVMFTPCFWGRKISKGMHGYHPELESQKGIFLCSDISVFKEYIHFSSKTISAKNISQVVKRYLL